MNRGVFVKRVTQCNRAALTLDVRFMEEKKHTEHQQVLLLRQKQSIPVYMMSPSVVVYPW